MESIDEQALLRTFSCPLDSLEDCFDFLNEIVARGHTLRKAYLMEGRKRTPLEVDLFDGNPIWPAIQALEKEWRALLSQPVKRA